MLKLDGDYLDVYINGEKTFSLIKLTKEIKKQFENLLEYNRCDLTNISWPRRADGSMDYSQSVNNEKENTQNNNDNNTLIESDQTKDKVNSMPMWAWIVIIGGAAVIVGGAAVFVIKRKK